MTDRELLELAAKAADIDYEPDNQNAWPWDPLENDGDALRLAVRLEIDLYPQPGSVVAVGCIHSAAEFHGSDPYAATRRAIVRAAAAIGQSLAATSSGDSR